MAELILTEEEKAAPFYSYWDNESLGKAVRCAMVDIVRASADSEKWTMYNQAAAAILVGRTIDVNAAHSHYGFKKFSVGDQDHGDWEVIVRRKMNPLKRLWNWAVNLFSRPERLSITETHNPDGSKDVEVEWENRKEKNEDH